MSACSAEVPLLFAPSRAPAGAPPWITSALFSGGGGEAQGQWTRRRHASARCQRAPRPLCSAPWCAAAATLRLSGHSAPTGAVPAAVWGDRVGGGVPVYVIIVRPIFKGRCCRARYTRARTRRPPRRGYVRGKAREETTRTPQPRARSSMCPVWRRSSRTSHAREQGAGRRFRRTVRPTRLASARPGAAPTCRCR